MNRDLVNWAIIWVAISCIVGFIVFMANPSDFSEIGFSTVYTTALLCVMLAGLISMYSATVLYLWDTGHYMSAKVVGVFVVTYLLLALRFVYEDSCEKYYGWKSGANQK